MFRSHYFGADLTPVQMLMERNDLCNKLCRKLCIAVYMRKRYHLKLCFDQLIKAVRWTTALCIPVVFAETFSQKP